MERTKKTWLLEILLAAILAALLGLWGWTATKVVQNGERIIEVKAELQEEIVEVRVDLQKEIAEVRVDLQKEIAEVNAKIAEINGKMDLLITGLNISVAPKESADAAPSGANRSGFQVGAGKTATE